MKQGTEFPVTIQGIQVANAIVEGVEDDKVTLFIPATRVIMGVRHELTDTNPEPEVDRQFAGLDNGESGGSDAIDSVDDERDFDNYESEPTSLRNQNLDSEV